MNWPKRPFYWTHEGRECISVPFTWQLPRVRQSILNGNLFSGRPLVGGPAVKLMPEYLADIADIGDHFPGVLQMVNPLATRTTEGCPNGCGFCAVPCIEGEFRELEDWPDLPVICDNNLLAASKPHFDKVIDRLKHHRGVDFNQGLDCRRLLRYEANRLAELDCMVRLAWDATELEGFLSRAVEQLLAAGFPKSRIRCYVLIGYRDTPEDALYRIRTLWGRWRILPNVQRYVPLESLTRRYVGPNWTGAELTKMHRWGNRARLLNTIPYEEFDHTR